MQVMISFGLHPALHEQNEWRGHLTRCRHDMFLRCVMRGGIAHGMDRTIHRGLHTMFLIFFHTVSQVVLKPGRYTLLALKYRISKSQDLIDQNEREIAAQVSWFSFDDQDPVNTAASLVPQAFLTLVFEG